LKQGGLLKEPAMLLKNSLQNPMKEVGEFKLYKQCKLGYCVMPLLIIGMFVMDEKQQSKDHRKDRDVTIPCLKSLLMPTSFDQLIYKCEAELVGS
jgi:hypothetical protein